MRNNLSPLTWKLVGLNENRWRIKLFPKNNSFKTIGEGLIYKNRINTRNNFKPSYSQNRNFDQLQLPNVKRNKFLVVIDPGHGGVDPGAIGIRGIRETDVVLDVSKIVQKLLNEKGVGVRLTRNNEVDLDLQPRVSFANSIDADVFVSIHANASRGKEKILTDWKLFIIEVGEEDSLPEEYKDKF